MIAAILAELLGAFLAELFGAILEAIFHVILTPSDRTNTNQMRYRPNPKYRTRQLPKAIKKKALA